MKKSFHTRGLHGVALLAALAGGAAWAGDSEDSRMLASQCAQCHGTDGKAVGDIETLDGKSRDSIYSDLIEMKYGTDRGELMHLQAKGYSDSQLCAISRYFAHTPETDTSPCLTKGDD